MIELLAIIIIIFGPARLSETIIAHVIESKVNIIVILTLLESTRLGKPKTLSELTNERGNRRGGGLLSGKVGPGICGPNRVLFRPLRFTNGPFLFENWFRYRLHFCKIHNFQ